MSEPRRLGAASPDLANDLHCAVESDVTVLITGSRETARAVARWIHDHGRRQSGPLAVVDCARTDAEPVTPVPSRDLHGLSELTPGFLRRLDGGVLVLEHVGCLTRETLEALLRDVEASHQWPGDVQHRRRPPGVRLVATTSTDLSDRGLHPAFPNDLLYSLNAIHLVVRSDRPAPAWMSLPARRRTLGPGRAGSAGRARAL